MRTYNDDGTVTYDEGEGEQGKAENTDAQASPEPVENVDHDSGTVTYVEAENLPDPTDADSAASGKADTASGQPDAPASTDADSAASGAE